MSYHPRQDHPDRASFITTRTRNSELWFANNKGVEDFTLGLLAKLSERYNPDIYGFAIEGNHLHTLAGYPYLNRADFMRDLNSGVACSVKRYTRNYPGGGLWARRFSAEVVPAPEDIERQFFYTALQPVKDGLVSKLSEYPFYNCFHDAACGIKRKIKHLDTAAYNAALRHNPHTPKKDYITEYTLEYKRIPGYEHLSQKEYKDMMHKKLEIHRQEILAERARQGKTGFVGREALLKMTPGAPAKNSKSSHRHSHRPRVLCVCPERRAYFKSIYFSNYFRYKEASKRFLAGEIDVEFPPNMYRPPSWMVPKPAGPYSVL